MIKLKKILLRSLLLLAIFTPLSATFAEPSMSADITKTTWNESAIDLLPCKDIPITQDETLLGVTWPSSDASLTVRLIELGLYYENINVCRQDWDTILPTITPIQENEKLSHFYPWVVFSLALILSLILFNLLPQNLRKNVTVLGLLTIAISTWGLGSAGLFILNQQKIPQHYIYQDYISIQQSAEITDWFAIKGVRELDQVLLAKKLKINQVLPEINLDILDKLTLLTQPGGEKIITNKSEVSIITEGEQLEYKGERYIKVKVEVAAKGKAKPEPIDAKSKTIAWIPATQIKQSQLINKLTANMTFKVIQPLNIRKGPSVKQDIIRKPLAINSKVITTGLHDGDWWKIKTISGETGWVSSLWLRRMKN